MFLKVIPLLFCCVALSETANILMLPFAWKSHVFQMSTIGEALVTRGHHVTLVLPPTYPDFNKLKEESSFEVLPYRVKDKDFYAMSSEQVGGVLEIMMASTPIEELRRNVDGFKEMCSNLLSDEVAFETIKSKNFDLAIVDMLVCSRCFLVLPYRLGIPYMGLTAVFEPWLLRNPALPSFVPFSLTEYYTEKMSFVERVMNLYTLLDWTYDTRIPYVSDDGIRQYIADKPFKSLDDLARGSELWLLGTDLLLDYPRPCMAHEVHIGGLSTKPAKPLPIDLDEFVASAPEEVIITSFGSFDVLGEEQLRKFLDAFRKIPQRVVLRSSLGADVLETLRIPENVLVQPWIPQNDLLGHPNTRLFITHCGANGQFEALYHGVPMLGFPVFGDQPYNARRHTHHGFGLYMDILNFDSESLKQSIERIVNNKTYYDNIKKASAIFRSRPLTPVERAAYHIEDVLQYGADHLHSHALIMPWYEYLMLDILALVLGLVVLAVMLVCGVVCKFIGRSNVQSRKTKKD